MNSLVKNRALLAFTPTADQTLKEGYAVKLDSVGSAVLLVSSTIDSPFGVIVEGSPTTGKSSVAVAAGGFSGTLRVKLDASPGTVQAGTLLQTTPTGTFKADTLVGNRMICAQAMEAGAANELIEAVLFKPLAA